MSEDVAAKDWRDKIVNPEGVEKVNEYVNNAVVFGKVYKDVMDYVEGMSDTLVDSNYEEGLPRRFRDLYRETTKNVDQSLRDYSQWFEEIVEATNEENYPELFEEIEKDYGELDEENQRKLAVIVALHKDTDDVRRHKYDIKLALGLSELQEFRPGVPVLHMDLHVYRGLAEYGAVPKRSGAVLFVANDSKQRPPFVVVGKSMEDGIEAHEIQHLVTDLLARTGGLPHMNTPEETYAPGFGLIRNEFTSFIYQSARNVEYGSTPPDYEPLGIDASSFHGAYVRNKDGTDSVDVMRFAEVFRTIGVCLLVCDELGIDRLSTLYAVLSSSNFDDLERRIVRKTFQGVSKDDFVSAVDKVSRNTSKATQEKVKKLFGLKDEE